MTKSRKAPAPKTPEKTKPQALRRMTEDEMRAFVRDYLKGDIFTHHSIPAGQERLLYSVFLPLALGAMATVKKAEIKKIGCIYGRTDDHTTVAGRAINGFPIFLACGFVHVDDWKRIVAAVTREEEYERTRKIEI